MIEGLHNNQQFACADNPCYYPVTSEGTNILEYWALSSWGDSSRKGTMTVKVDTVLPNLNLLVNGTLGQSNWYVSNTTITAEGADDTSGIYEKVLSIDNGNTWIPSTTLNDGVYVVEIRITDNAYNISTASTTIQVDTTTPTLSLNVTGTKGNNNYYVSKPKITATTFDTTSGIANVQAKINNGNWIDTNEITLPDGIHTYQFRVYDNAGNMTESSIQQIAVDTTPPSVEADEEINLGEIVFYTLQDNGSGLWIERIVIEDEDEKYKKIVWLQEISGNKIKGDILWDGKFADKALAGIGEYYITFKISDRAGNETFYTTIVNVNPISYLQSIPEFIPPESEEAISDENTSNEETNQQNFGGEQTIINESTEQTFELVTGISNGMASSNSLPAPSLILTGVLAATAVAVAMKVVHDVQKKREEEEAQSYQQAKNQAAKLNEAEADRKANLWMQGQIKNFFESLPSLGLSQEQMLEIQNTFSAQGLSAAQSLADKFLGKNATSAASHSQTAGSSTNTNPFVGASASGGLGSSSSSGGFFSTLWDAGVNYVTSFGNALVETATEIKDSVVSAWNQVTTWASNTYTTATNAITNFAVNTWNSISTWANNTWESVTNWVSNTYTNITTALSNNPLVAWGTAATITLATAGTIYYVNCNGLPVMMPPTSSVIHFAGIFSLPAVGWFTTSKKQKRYGLIIGILFLGIFLSACGGIPTNTPAGTPTSTICPPTQTPSQTLQISHLLLHQFLHRL